MDADNYAPRDVPEKGNCKSDACPLRKREGASTLPGIGLSVVFGQKSERALVSVSLILGPYSAKGYDDLIAREGTEWVVVAIHSTWIA